MSLPNHLELVVPGILLLGIFCQWIAWRINIPSILPLLLVGLIIGPICNTFNPADYISQSTLADIISFSVAIILFEGALTLKFKEIKASLLSVWNLITIGVAVTIISSSLLIFYVLGTDWKLACLGGAILVVTGPTVIIPLLRNTRASSKISSILRWEGILIDPIGALLAVLVFNFVLTSDYTFSSNIFLEFVLVLLTSSGVGLLGGWIISLILRKYLVPDYLCDITILGFVLGGFSLSNMISHDSGLLAVTVMGIYLANLNLRQIKEIWHFKEKLSTLLISILFIVLASSISMDSVKLLDWRCIIVIAGLMFIVRPLSVFISTSNFILPRFGIGTKNTLNFKEKLFLSWIAPRGIVAASVASLFSIKLKNLGYTEADILVPLVFLVIVVTVLFQGATAKRIAIALGIADKEPQGFLLLSANRFAQLLAHSLKKEGFVVRLVDNNWTHVREARLQNLEVYYGNILSEEIEAEADLSGIGRLLALTSNQEANGLACIDYRNQFGSSEVYQLSTYKHSPHKTSNTINKLSFDKRAGRILFGYETTLHSIDNLLHKGATIKKTTLTDQFTYEDFLKKYSGSCIPILAIKSDKQNKGREILMYTADRQISPSAGWDIIALVREPIY